MFIQILLALIYFSSKNVKKTLPYISSSWFQVNVQQYFQVAREHNRTSHSNAITLPIKLAQITTLSPKLTKIWWFLNRLKDFWNLVRSYRSSVDISGFSYKISIILTKFICQDHHLHHHYHLFETLCCHSLIWPMDIYIHFLTNLFLTVDFKAFSIVSSKEIWEWSTTQRFHLGFDTRESRFLRRQPSRFKCFFTLILGPFPDQYPCQNAFIYILLLLSIEALFSGG